MAKSTVVTLVCDGCAEDSPTRELTEGAEGTAKITMTIAGETAEDGKEVSHTIDLCNVCAEKMPAGTVTKKRGRKAGNRNGEDTPEGKDDETPADGDADTPAAEGEESEEGKRKGKK